MKDFKLNQLFDLIIIPFNSLLHLLTDKDLSSCFNCIKNHLSNNGVLLIDIFVPDPELLYRNPNKKYKEMIIDHPDVGRCVVWQKSKYDQKTEINKINWNNLDLVFLSLPNGKAQEMIKRTFNKYKNIKFIDLSADFRIEDSITYKKNYKKHHKAKELIKKSLYSISEFNKKKIKNYRIIANPGCYPTSIQLPLIPLIKKKLIITENITIDSKSGYSGAGKNFEKKFNYKFLYDSTYAYNTKNHRHISEIDQEFKKYSKKKILFSFNPHIVPTFRGILSSIYLKIPKNISVKRIRNELVNFYKDSYFVKILKINSQIGTGNVINTNYCEISVCETRVKNKIIIFSAIDNLIKGAAGQAVQNMNLMNNLKENQGFK